jgi:hypothetical protein
MVALMATEKGPEQNALSKMSSTTKVHSKEPTADDLQLLAQGHVAELPRNFSAFATLATAFSITNSWVGIAGKYCPCSCVG